MDICNRIFATIEKKQLKSSHLATQLGISKSVISNWKTRKTNPPSEYIVGICEFLGVSISYLLTGKELTNNDSLSTEEKEIINEYNKLNDRSKTIVKACLYKEIDKMNEQQSDDEIIMVARGTLPKLHKDAKENIANSIDKLEYLTNKHDDI